ncbi:MAG: PilZ domain-containing protein [Nitrospirota bacterium]
MDKRRSKRIIESLEAEITLDGVNYSGIIMNFSESGLYMVTATVYDVMDVPNNSILGLKCTLPSGKAVDISCEVKWFHTKPSPFGVTFSMGMEIDDPPFQYKEFLRTLQ